MVGSAQEAEVPGSARRPAPRSDHFEHTYCRPLAGPSISSCGGHRGARDRASRSGGNVVLRMAEPLIQATRELDTWQGRSELDHSIRNVSMRGRSRKVTLRYVAARTGMACEPQTALTQVRGRPSSPRSDHRAFVRVAACGPAGFDTSNVRGTEASPRHGPADQRTRTSARARLLPRARRSVCHDAARRSRRRGHEGGAARHGRRHPRLGPAVRRPRDRHLLSRGQPEQDRHGPRPG
ncbi:MAG: hypothetical protein QOJ30_3791 [Pseudonocardiales bacterium]|nr:hypothetical protein [Pseudonocardiales bacterium]